MKTLMRPPISTLLCAMCVTAPAAWAQQPLQKNPELTYERVTDARLQNPEPKNWLQYRANYAGWGYSPLDKINAENVGNLTLAWAFASGQVEGHQSSPRRATRWSRSMPRPARNSGATRSSCRPR